MKKGEKRKTYYVGIDRQFSPSPRYLTPLETEILHPLKPNAFVRNPFAELEEEDEFIPITEKNHVLNNVTVKAKRRYFTNDDWRWKNEAYGKQYASLYYNADGEPVPSIVGFIMGKLKTELDEYGYKTRDMDRQIYYIYDNDEGRGVGFLDEAKSIYIVFNEQMSPSLGRWDIIQHPKQPQT